MLQRGGFIMTYKRILSIMVIFGISFMSIFWIGTNSSIISYEVAPNEYIKSVDSYEEAISYESLYNLKLLEYSDYGYALYSSINENDELLLDSGFNYNAITFADGSPWRTTTTTEDKYYDSQYGLFITNTDDAWIATTGSSQITIAIIDTGIDIYHEEFVGRISPLSKNVVTGVVGTSAVIDDYGHGTMVAGIIGATKDNTVGIAGITQNTVLLVIKANETNEPSFLDSNIIEAIYYAIEQDVDVINLSLGGTYANPETKEAIDEAIDAGIVVVAASGNEGTSEMLYPASFDNVISVGAVDSLSTVATYSTFNDQVDIAAPGSDIITTGIGSSYVSGSGTSFAAPHITGIIALYLSLYPTADVNEVKVKLFESAKDLGSIGVDPYYGYGLVDADRFLTSVFYTVSFDTGAGEIIDPLYVPDGKILESLPIPTLINQVFMGWYTDELRSVPFEPGLVVSSDMILYALFSDSYHTVHFISEGSQVADIVVEHFDTLTLPVSTKSGYNFVGWYTDQEYQNQYEPSPILEDITLYAYFEAIIYHEITYVVFDQVSNISEFSETEIPVLYIPSIEGYIFDGWYIDSAFTMIYSPSYLNEDMILYAKFTVETFDITLHFDNQTEVITVDYNTIPSLPEKEIEGLVFAGWYVDIALTTKYNVTTVKNDFDLYAKFVTEVYTIDLIIDGVFYETLYFEPDELIVLPEISDETKTLLGWYEDSSYTIAYHPETATTNDTLYGETIEREYEIRFFDSTGSIISSLLLHYGDIINYPNASEKAEDISFTYLFVGWSSSTVTVKSDEDITPVYEAIFKEDTVSLNPGLDTIIQYSQHVDGGIDVIDERLRIEVISDIDTSLPGKYEIIYQIYFEDMVVYEYSRFVRVLAESTTVIITLNPGITTIYVGNTYIEAGAGANIGEVIINGEVDSSTPGVYIITYQVEIDNIIYLKTRVVHVLSIDELQTIIILKAIIKEEAIDEEN